MKRLIQSIAVGIVFLVICGLGYPLLVLGIGQLAFPHQANGSLTTVGGKVVGSELIGQDFKDPRFFHGRVSAVHYNTYAAGTPADRLVPGSGSANLAVSNPDLKKRIQTDVSAFLQANPGLTVKDLPADLFTSSYSGLDPDITPADAQVQVDGIVRATGLSKSQITQIMAKNTTGPDLGVLGQKRVNVLQANLDIYKLLAKK